MCASQKVQTLKNYGRGVSCCTLKASLILIHILVICHVDLSGRVVPKITKLEFSQVIFHMIKKLNLSERRSFDIEIVDNLNFRTTLFNSLNIFLFSHFG